MSLRRLSFYSSKIADPRLPFFYYQWANKQLLSIPTQFRIKAAQFDVAGTLVDRYCLAPLFAFQEAFKKKGFVLTPQQITGPMGKNKIEHIQDLLSELMDDWYRLYARDPNQQDVMEIYADFNVYLQQCITHYAKITPYTLEAIDFLRQHNIKFLLTSGYPRSLAKLAISQLIQTDLPHAMTTSNEVTAGTRIEMLEKNNLKLGIPPESMSRVIFFYGC